MSGFSYFVRTMDSVIEVIADSWNPWRRLSRMQEPVPIVPAVQPLGSVNYGISPFQPFKTFNRCAPFKALRRFKVQRFKSSRPSVEAVKSAGSIPGGSAYAPGYTLIASTRRPCALAAAH